MHSATLNPATPATLRRLVWGILIAGVPGCAQSTPEARILDEVIHAVGGRSAVETARMLIQEGEGEASLLGQSTSPDTGSLRYRITELRREVDYTNARWRQDQVVTPLWAAQDPSPRKEVAGFADGIAYDIGPDGTAERLTDTVARARRAS